MKNNLYRFRKEKVMMVMVVVIMPIIISFGVYFSGTDNIKGKIAVVGASSEEQGIIEASMEENDKLKIDFLEESPRKTELIKGIYLAEIRFEGDKAKVISYGKEDVKKALEAGLKGETYVSEDNNSTVQGKGVGFLIMFLFMGSTTMVMDLFLSDRESGTYTRVLNGNISYFQYISGQLFYATVILSLPSTIWSVLILKVMNVDLNISYLLLRFIIFLVGILSSSFGMFTATIFKNRAAATMGGSIITMITCLLGGCLISFTDTNKIIGFIRDLLPQKRLIDLSNSFNNGHLIFVTSSILIFVLISVILGKRQYENGNFVV